jgi:hypothetical protein
MLNSNYQGKGASRVKCFCKQATMHIGVFAKGWADDIASAQQASIVFELDPRIFSLRHAGGQQKTNRYGVYRQAMQLRKYR